MIPYGRQLITNEDIEAVVAVLKSDWLTTGPAVETFEKKICEYVGTKHAVAVCNGTAALHVAMYAAGIGPGDEVIVPTMTFAATSNAVVYQGGTPVFVDVCAETLLIDPALVEAKITSRTKAIVVVDYAGQPCDYEALRVLANKHKLLLIADASHSLGGSYRGTKVGALADLTTFSFHPVKQITTGEGGMVVTNNADFHQKMRRFRNHGITTDHRQREQQGLWFYEMVDLGYNFRLTDIQCALGLTQLKRLPSWIERRQEVARRYDEAFANASYARPLGKLAGASHAYHLYVVRLDLERLKFSRDIAFKKLRDAGLGVNVHYIPVHLHPFYKERFGTKAGLCPVAEAAYERILSIPLYHGMSDVDVNEVIRTVKSL